MFIEPPTPKHTAISGARATAGVAAVARVAQRELKLELLSNDYLGTLMEPWVRMASCSNALPTVAKVVRVNPSTGAEHLLFASISQISH